MIQNTTSSAKSYDGTIFLFKLFNVEVLEEILPQTSKM